jgi:hypothetical protein
LNLFDFKSQEVSFGNHDEIMDQYNRLLSVFSNNNTNSNAIINNNDEVSSSPKKAPNNNNESLNKNSKIPTLKGSKVMTQSASLIINSTQGDSSNSKEANKENNVPKGKSNLSNQTSHVLQPSKPEQVVQVEKQKLMKEKLLKNANLVDFKHEKNSIDSPHVEQSPKPKVVSSSSPKIAKTESNLAKMKTNENHNLVNQVNNDEEDEDRTSNIYNEDNEIFEENPEIEELNNNIDLTKTWSNMTDTEISLVMAHPGEYLSNVEKPSSSPSVQLPANHSQINKKNKVKLEVK